MIYEFGAFEVDATLFELRGSGRRLDIQPKALELLLCLLRNRSRMVTGRELLATLWPSGAVGNMSLAKAVHGARHALRAGGLRREAIRTVWGRGYRFTAPVRESRPEGASLHAAAPHSALVTLDEHGEIEPGSTPWPTHGAPSVGGLSIRACDGVAVANRGDLFSMVWKESATAERAHWSFDEADRFAKEMSGTFLALIIVLPSSAPPNYSTAMELILRQARLRHKVRRQSHVAVGGGLWLRIVSGALRAMELSVRTRLGPVTMSATIDQGIERILERREPSTPTEAEIRQDLVALFEVLEVESPPLEAA